MPEELENTPQDAQDAPEPNDAPTEDELTVIKGQLQAEQAALAETQAALAAKDDRISELETSLAEAQEAAAQVEPLQSKLTDMEKFGFDAANAADQATQKYLETVRVLNPALPSDLIDGATIEEIDASVEKAQAITDHVRASLAAEQRNGRVPAGAPTREVNLDGLSADELIRLGISQGGNDQ